MKKLTCFTILCFISLLTYSQSPSIQWQKSLGGTTDEYAYYVENTSDGGYIITGASKSNDGDLTIHYGAAIKYDCWVVKFDNVGVVQWQKSLGGTESDQSICIKQTSDGGYILVGSSFSNDIDVTGHHGAATKADVWVVKLDAVGTIQWQKSLGGTLDDFAYSIKETTDGSFVLVGQSYSNDNDVSGHHLPSTLADVWIAKINNSGTIIWQNSFGGSSTDIGYDIVQTIDGGYAAIAITYSNDGNVSGNHGDKDAWLLKLDSLGILQWQTCLGGTNAEELLSIKQTADNGFILVGDNSSSDGDLLGIPGLGLLDSWVVKTNSVGIIQWTKLIGGSQYEYGRSVEITTDGGFVLSSTSSSNDVNVSSHYGATTASDFWITKIDTSGTIQWEESYGGTLDDDVRYARQTPDGGFVCVGSSQSNDFDVTFNNGQTDYWIVKLGAFVGINEQNKSTELSVSVYPNPSVGEFHFSGLENENTIEVVDISGRIIFQNATKNNSYSLDLSENSKGLYFYRIINDKNESQIGKILLR